MSYPEAYDPAMKSWTLSTLPFLPEQYKYEVIGNVRKQFEVVKKQLNRPDIDVIYNAGDSAREGEYIQRLTYRMAGWNKAAKIKRIWIDSQTEDEIKRGIREAKDSSEYDRLADAAYMRAIEDFAIGINFSRALSCKFGYEYNKKIKSQKYKPLSVGRVMTCVLGMIVERERQIREFKPTGFYKIKADTGFESQWKAVETSHFYQSSLLYNESGFKSKENAEKFILAMDKVKKLKVENVERKKESKKAPLLFNLAELQNECSKRFKISPDKTLEIAQELYEMKLTTYPRTDARVISTAVAGEIEKNIRRLTGYQYSKDFAQNILKQKWHVKIADTKYCDDSKISDHYAIIPTGQLPAGELDELELNIYNLIISRFLSIFYPPAEYEKVDVTLLHPTGERFFASEKILKSKGYMEIAGCEKENKKENLAAIVKGSVLTAEFKIDKGQTSAPNRYNSGNIILAMENAGNLIEDEELRAQIKGCGIGTSATRAETIKKLVKIGYICINPKTQVVTPHADGEALYDIVNDVIPAMLSPRMTANWEKGLSQIEHGEITKEKYQQILNNYVIKTIDEIKRKDAEEAPDENLGVILGTCPICGGDIVTTRFGCGCSNYKEKGCWFLLGEFALKQMDNEQLDKLITEGRTDLIHGLISKKGKKFSASFYLDMEEHKVKMEIPGQSYEKENTKLICPRANCRKKGTTLIKTGTRLSCECGFAMYTTICSRELDDDELEQILDGDTVYVSGLVSNKGKAFDAYIKMKRDGTFKMSFDKPE